MTEEVEDEADEDDDEDEDELPRVVIARFRDLGEHAPAALVKTEGSRAIWFLLEMDAELVGLFERIPEDPIPKGRASAVLGALRAFAEAKSDELQSVLGPTEGISFGFHVDASVDDVRASFEDDGFVIIATLEGGRVRLLEE